MVIETVPPIESIEYDFYDSQLRRSYLEDTPSLIGSIVSTGTTPPSAPATGQLFFNTSTKKLFVYDGTDWIQMPTLDSSGNLKIGGKYLKE